jgi:hypothetical protein
MIALLGGTSFSPYYVYRKLFMIASIQGMSIGIKEAG